MNQTDATPDVSLLEDIAAQVAERYTVTRNPPARPSLLGRLHEREPLLWLAHDHFARLSEEKQALTYAGEWLLDNFYVVQQALRQVYQDMPEGYYRQLPKLGTAPFAGYPRVYALAQTLLDYCDRHVDMDRLERFVQAYQQVTTLTMGELWALPTMLRLYTLECLIHTIARVAGLVEGEEEPHPSPSQILHDLGDDAIVANCILSLRSLATQDWKEFFESVSPLEETLRKDPAGVYAAMDFETRNRYRGVVEELARVGGWTEVEVAQAAVDLARQSPGDAPRAGHVGFYLLDEGRAQLETLVGYRPPWRTRAWRWVFAHPLLLYLGIIGSTTLLVLAAVLGYVASVGGTIAQLIALALFFLLPASAVAVDLTNALITHLVPPRTLPRMDFGKGIPPEFRTTVVVPSLLSSADEVRSLLHHLELHYVGNADPHLHFALLTDFTDAPEENMPEDPNLLEQVWSGVQALNKKYGRRGEGPFYLFHRHRLWNPLEGCWMGWERKRGKLVEFNRLLRGSEETTYSVREGDMSILSQVRYVITLDADTTLPQGSAQRLIATLAHPLNQAEFDPESGALRAGYTVLQPRVEIQPASANRSFFTRVFSGDTGLDLYTRAVSDVYQDLFGEGNYVGKGIYDVDAFERCLAGRAPENALLSHDLFEGIHGRAGLVTDVILLEDYPANYPAQLRRLHRWVRGDWQILPWLFPRVPAEGGRRIPNDLSLLDRWKIVDNLRRSLLAPALVAFLTLGWLWLPGPTWVWTLLGLLVLALPFLVSLVTYWARYVRGGGKSPVSHDLGRWLLETAFLLCEAVYMLEAIGVTLVRLFITRRHLLRWVTAAHTLRLFGRDVRIQVLWRQMGGASLGALGLALLVLLVRPTALLAAAPLLLIWSLSPQVAHWVSRPAQRATEVLSDTQRRQLRCLARRTWLFFEQFIGPDDHWLPQDHFQENPRGLVAHRTSPTNIGLAFLSTLAAYDFGYIGPIDLMLRLRASFEGMSRLERYRGHLLNWYDTRTLAPLPPPYVSTVDSGNLLGCLLVLRQGLLILPHEPVFQWKRWQGLLDTADVLMETVTLLGSVAMPLQAHLNDIRRRVLAAQDDTACWIALLVELSGEGLEELDRLLVALIEPDKPPVDTAALQDIYRWSERLHQHLTNMRRELDMLAPWLFPLQQPPSLLTQLAEGSDLAAAWHEFCAAMPLAPSLVEIPQLCRKGRQRLERLRTLLPNTDTADAEEARAWCVGLEEKLYNAQMTVQGFLIGFNNLSGQAEAYFREMDLSFLFNRQRQVFAIGYNVAAGKLDTNHYDLLASEARIASLVAIAKGEVPQSHWLHLGRPVTQIDGARGLLSWNGSMFEYLMPTLLMRSYEETLLDQTCRAVIDRQIAYGRQKGVPWGISESGYYRFDANQNYQYRGFGVPGLGFKRGLGDDLVITPYASLLALPFRPRAVLQNIERLIDQQMLGHYGFYEALDYTSTRLAVGQDHATIYSYMVHHQGMIFLSLVNYLEDEVMLRRFHADPRIQSVEILLQEQIPRQAPVEQLPEEVAVVERTERVRVALGPWRVTADTLQPRVHVLSNGRYSTLLTHAGSGTSSWREIDLTRWRADATLDNWGTWLYIQDLEDSHLWSVGLQPTAAAPDEYEALFSAHQVEFHRRDRDIALRCEIAVAPDDDVEVRRVSLTNTSDRPRRLRLVSYSEVVLAPQMADRRHPAFNRLFIESEYLPDLNALLFRRRPRSADEQPLYLLHMLVVGQGRAITGAHESDRARFLGRGRSPRSPAALEPGSEGLTGTVGATLDPIMALGQEITLEPQARAQLAYVTLVAGSRQEALALARRYQVMPAAERVFEQARLHAERDLHRLGLAAPEIERIQRLLSLLLYPQPALRAAPLTLAANEKGQPGLWPYAISGDYPILLVRVGSQEETALVLELLQAHAYWRSRRLKIDLVILNERETAYDQELQGQLYRLIVRTGGDAWMNQRGGIFLLRADQLSEADRVLLESSARAVLDGGEGNLAGHLERHGAYPPLLPRFVPTIPPQESAEPTPPLPRPTDLSFDNGLGGFSADGREYAIYLEPGQQTPLPWINVVANPDAGFLISEAGAGCTWAVNSGENRLTTWWNDPVSDTSGEALYLRDEETGWLWSPTPLPAGSGAPYLVRHGAGYSIFEHNSYGLKQRLRVFVVPDAPVKVLHLRLENTWRRTRRITATCYAEWVLGNDRDTHQPYIIPEFDAVSNALLARNPYNEEFGRRAAFLATSKEPHGLTTDRAEFLGVRGTLARPAALERVGLTGTVRAGLDPCAALQVQLWLAPGETEDVFFLLGQGADRSETLRLAQQYQDAAEVEKAWKALGRFWDDLLGTVQAQTPDQAMNLLLNRWLLYQTLSCRVWGRSALYQSSGAFGYRDQLQDVMALLQTAPQLAREHILRAARHQFEEGDVLHWWHPPSGRGVRTRCSDDMLWLPYVTAHYVAATGDAAILAEKEPFLRGDPLKAEEKERYGFYERSVKKATLYEHCWRAIERGKTTGAHNLPLIGSHDWNDGLNRLGIEGRGESVWLGWFLCDTMTRFAPLCELMGEGGRADLYRQEAQELAQALEQTGWDGAWYLRAYDDDGVPLGSAANDECQIDSIAQSWAVLCGVADPQRAAQAMAAVDERLVREDEQLVLLFTPPFDQTPRDPGYIKGYLPGIRENGGQYTHAAAWVAWAFAELGQGDRAEALFRLLNPIYHGLDAAGVSRYRVEPYVVAADVYSVPPHVGRGGWTWYTGSAAWMYRLGLEAILGLRREGDVLRLVPCIPTHWRGYAVTYRYGKTLYRIEVANPAGVCRGVQRVVVDGQEQTTPEIRLHDDGLRHEVQIVLGTISDTR